LPTPPNENGIGGYQCSYCALTAQVETLKKALEEITNIVDDMTDATGSMPASYLMRGIARHALGKDVS